MSVRLIWRAVKTDCWALPLEVLILEVLRGAQELAFLIRDYTDN